MRWRLAVAAVALALAPAFAGGCAGVGARTVTDVRNVPGASGRPTIEAVHDLGDLERLPDSGARVSTAGGDGLFAVGEAVLIEGDDFGKQPTVLFDGRPGTIIARTGAGGIVTRVPPQVASGRIELEVSNPRGGDVAALPVMRHVLALQPNEGRLHVLTIEPGGHVDVANILPVPGALDLAFSPDGQMAYVLQRRADANPDEPAANLVAVAMGVAGGPRIVNQIPLPLSEPRFLVAGNDARALFAVGLRRAVGIDVSIARSPAAFEPFALRLAPASAVPIAVAASPDGTRLAALLAEENRLAVFDVSDPSNPGAPVEITVAGDAPVVDVVFAPNGKQVWVVVGDTPTSVAGLEGGSTGGPAADTALVAVSVKATEDGLELAAKPAAAVDGARAPLGMTPVIGQVAAGTAIRSASRGSAAILSTLNRSVLATLAAPLSASAGAMLADSGVGIVLRSNLEGESSELFETDGPVTGLATTPDGRIAVASTTRVIRTGDAYRLEFGIYVGAIDGSSVRYTRLADVGPKAITLAPAPVAVSP